MNAILTQLAPAPMHPITAFLMIVMIVILMAVGFGIVIILGVLADWGSQKGKQQ